METIKNYVLVSDQLACAGQPTEQQLSWVKAQGFHVVINLGLLDPRYCLHNEADSVARLGLEYVHIPVQFGMPSQADLQHFIAVMDAHQQQRVFVHCAANYRATCFIALYGRLRLGWSESRGEALIAQVWEPDGVWRQFMHEVMRGQQEGARLAPA